MLETTANAELADPAARISTRTFNRLAEFTTREIGIKMPDSKLSMVQSRLLRRVRELGLRSIDEYFDRLFSSAYAESERAHFIDALTTNKTDFFREPQHFRMLTAMAIPSLERSGLFDSAGGVSVWSAPCSSGEEPYTLAMVLSEYAASHPGFHFRILATDVSTKVLRKAKEGIYTVEQALPIPSDLRRKYVLRGKGERRTLVRMSPALRRTVGFHHLNFMQDDYRVKEIFQVIFCRNVLIYFDRPTQESVVNKLCRNLIPGGYLFISHSESLAGLNVPLASAGPACFKKAK